MEIQENQEFLNPEAMKAIKHGMQEYIFLLTKVYSRARFYYKMIPIEKEKLLISPAQVVSISIKEMTVADSFSQDLAKASNQANLVPEPTV